MLRWVHFLAGITWIGLLYFFNLINAAFLKSLDGPTKNVVIPKLMPSALNWFRHGATVTVLAGSSRAVYNDPALGQRLRGALASLKPVEAMERLLKKLNEFETNDEFLGSF